MKVKITTLVLCVMLSVCVSAQQKHDSFFDYKDYERAIDMTPVPFQTSDGHGFNDMHVNAPLGNGIFITVLISFAYILSKRKEEAK